VSENRALRRIFGPERDEVTEAVENYMMRSCITCTVHQILLGKIQRRMRWVGHIARMGQMKNEDHTLVGKPEGKRPLERPRRRWEDNIKMDLTNISLEGVDWIHLGRDRNWWQALVNT
jgi:hypothetical protein